MKELIPIELLLTDAQYEEIRNRASKDGYNVVSDYIMHMLFNADSKKESNYAFVDGSFNQHTNVYGYGGFLRHGGEKEVLQGSDNDEEMAKMRNVSGELLGSMAAIRRALELGLKDLTIYYDYSGIEMWATGQWKRNNKYTKSYYEFCKSISNTIELHFVKVKGHAGISGNEEADILAKEAVGLI